MLCVLFSLFPRSVLYHVCLSTFLLISVHKNTHFAIVMTIYFLFMRNKYCQVQSTGGGINKAISISTSSIDNSFKGVDSLRKLQTAKREERGHNKGDMSDMGEGERQQ